MKLMSILTLVAVAMSLCACADECRRTEQNEAISKTLRLQAALTHVEIP